MQYKDFVVDYEPINGLNHKIPFTDLIATEGRMCRVYDVEDQEREFCLCEFPLVDDIYYTDGDEQKFEESVKQTIDLNEYTIRLRHDVLLLNQKISIFVKMLVVLLEPVPESEWRDLFINKAELTVDDLNKIGLKLPEEK